ncbi:MAG: class I SAM-dependent methyltransferase [Planctomycetota bacterium]
MTAAPEPSATGSPAGTPAGATASAAAAAPPCPVCGSSPDAFRPAFRAEGHAFARCRRCRFVRMIDGPATARLDAFYRADRASADAALQDHDKNLRRFTAILEQIERHRSPAQTPDRAPPLFVDIGCSIGTSLLAAQARGWRAIGLELAQSAVEVAQRRFELDVRAVTVDDSGLPRGSVAAVLMHHTLEHVEHPDRLLRRIHEVLEPGGVMYQCLPNHGSLKALLLGRHFGYGITDEHLSHFTPATLRRVVRRAGFDVLRTATWSYRQDPRLLHDVCQRVGLGKWLAKKCGMPPGEPVDAPHYIDFLSRTPWAFSFCNRLWPQRLCRWLRLGEDLHLIAQKPPTA